jgi:hypothetical protein
VRHWRATTVSMKKMNHSVKEIAGAEAAYRSGLILFILKPLEDVSFVIEKSLK